jgi:hypothetical protein
MKNLKKVIKIQKEKLDLLEVIIENSGEST